MISTTNPLVPFAINYRRFSYIIYLQTYDIRFAFQPSYVVSAAADTNYDHHNTNTNTRRTHVPLTCCDFYCYVATPTTLPQHVHFSAYHIMRYLYASVCGCVMLLFDVTHVCECLVGIILKMLLRNPTLATCL